MLYEKYNTNDIFKKKYENITENSIEIVLVCIQQLKKLIFKDVVLRF